ncbi:MAG: hypothetical protein IKW62_03805 [Clostridia bacterium]|nr:hypothetical protein [Clostridia bacterium]
MKKVYNANGLKTLSPNGSLVFCKNCEKIVASINKQGYRYINLSITCSCGSFGNLEIAKETSTSDPYEVINRMPKAKNGLAVCGVCNVPMFGVIDERVKNYSFYVECVCGKKYDLKPSFPKRLGETIEMLKNKD